MTIKTSSRNSSFFLLSLLAGVFSGACVVGAGAGTGTTPVTGPAPQAKHSPAKAPATASDVTRSGTVVCEGHRGLKLHPRSDGFSLDDPAVWEIATLAAQRRIPVLVHAGRGMDPLGDVPVRLVDANPGLQVILAHCGISDLAALAPEARSRPNLLFDTAWWNPADLAALFGWVDAGQILYASDMPYGAPLMSATISVHDILLAV